MLIDQVHIIRLRQKAWNKCLKNLTRVVIRFEKKKIGVKGEKINK